MRIRRKLRLGSLFAGIGGFDLGFESAGWRTAWQVELNPASREVLARHFPKAKRYGDIRDCGYGSLSPVECITAGFPCQDISPASRRPGPAAGLSGHRSGLFFEAIRVIREVQPKWVVVENVPALLSTNDCRDFQEVICRLADGGYVGYWRVLNASGFGVPQNRRRLFLVAGLGQMPPSEFLADARPVGGLPSAIGEEPIASAEVSWPSYTLLAHTAGSQISIGSEILIAHAGRRHSMAERARMSRVHGIPTGLDKRNAYQRYAAGNAVVPAIARWIAALLAAA